MIKWAESADSDRFSCVMYTPVATSRGHELLAVVWYPFGDGICEIE